MPSNLPVGIKNNNYLNVKTPTKNGKLNPWNDANGKPSGTDPHGHAVFSDPAYGVRAGILQLRAYFLDHDPKRQTVIAIIAEWAPASDTEGSIGGNKQNNPEEYAGFVAARMGVGVNQKLGLFHADKTISNVGQLRSLFYAMAVNEIGGGFKVPDQDFNAGLELIEPGITIHGTGIAQPQVVTSPTAAATAPAANAASAGGWKISGPVGRVDKGAANDQHDVLTVQSMLRNAAMILGDPQIDPGTINGMIDPEAAKSPTVQAIFAFQSRFFTHPDGLIEVNGRTWGELVSVLDGKPQVPVTAGKEFFPFASLPSANWTKAPLCFAANRDGGARAHAGCDLYFPKGTTIHAITDGTVVRGPYYFYNGTYALEVDHGSFLARYGEVQQETLVHENDKVTAGQPIARVGHLTNISVPSDMLHLEIYDKSGHGKLTVGANEGLKASGGRPFMRRKDLVDPAPFLNKWKKNLPGTVPALALAAAAPAPAAPDKVPTTGFCIHIRRIRQEKRAGIKHPRTVSEYQCYWNGEPIHDLEGQMVERDGPGDNTSKGVDKFRVEEKWDPGYPLAIQDGEYKTYNYASSGTPLPGLALENTGKRTGILIHPCHDNDGFLSSIGCINPAVGLKNADSRINLADSRNRVIAIIEAMKLKLGNAFPKHDAIPHAVVVIEGEPS